MNRIARRLARAEELVRRIWEHESQRPLREARARRHRQLAVRYRTLNRRWYGGELPFYKVRLVPRSPRSPWAHGAAGQCDDPSKTIFILEDLTAHECDSTLKHEVVHVHGAFFLHLKMRYDSTGRGATDAWSISVRNNRVCRHRILGRRCVLPEWGW